MRLAMSAVMRIRTEAAGNITTTLSDAMLVCCVLMARKSVHRQGKNNVYPVKPDTRHFCFKPARQMLSFQFQSENVLQTPV